MENENKRTEAEINEAEQPGHSRRDERRAHGRSGRRHSKSEHRHSARRGRHSVRYDEAGRLRRLLGLLLASFLTVLLVEGFNQGTVPRMLNYLAHRPQYFLFNWLVVFASFSITELCKHRRAVECTVAAVWVALGFANYMVCHNRTQPLTSGDLLITREILGMITVYFSWAQIVAMFAAAMAIILGVIFMYSRIPKRRRVNYAWGVGVAAGMICLTVCAGMVSMKTGFIPSYFEDRVDAYLDYGFSTCFSFTFGSHGISKPDEYSQQTVESILDEIDEPAATDAPAALHFDAGDNLNRPNIVFVQLESFFDVNTVIGAEFSEDPTPNFHHLLETCPTGELYVPTIGGGTANVEFEVMSGMNMDFFGAGETPYNTIIQEATCETIAYILREYGYSSTALHNNTGTFFSRNLDYANLGYDRFDPLEYMLGPTYNEIGWARDVVLTDEILRAMTNSEQRDLIFAITVESHGKYPDTYSYEDGDIVINSLPEEAYLAPFQNYVNTIPDVDTFIGELIDAFSSYDEPTIVIFYGDHLPALGLSSDILTTGDLYASRYVIWNNYGAEFEAPDMQAYRLSANLLRQLGISDGVLMKYHQKFAVDESGDEYMNQLQILEYDLLYGEQDAYGDHGAYQPTALALGIDPITITAVDVEYGRILVTGENFTAYSRIVAGDVALDTVFIDSKHIAARLTDATTTGTVYVAQMNTEDVELGRTKVFHVKK